MHIAYCDTQTQKMTYADGMLKCFYATTPMSYSLFLPSPALSVLFSNRSPSYIRLAFVFPLPHALCPMHMSLPSDSYLNTSFGHILKMLGKKP